MMGSAIRGYIDPVGTVATAMGAMEAHLDSVMVATVATDTGGIMVTTRIPTVAMPLEYRQETTIRGELQ